MFPLYPLLSAETTDESKSKPIRTKSASDDLQIEVASDRFVDLFKRTASAKHREIEK